MLNGLDDSGKDPLNNGLQHHQVSDDGGESGKPFTPPEPGAAPNAPDVPGSESIRKPDQMVLPPPDAGDEDHPPAAPDMPPDAGGQPPAAPVDPAAQAIDPQSFRFKSHADAESGYFNLRSHASRVEQENKTLRDQMEAQAKERRQNTIDAETGRQLEEFTNNTYSDLFKKINDLDSDAEDYDAQVAKLYADAALAVQRFKPAIDEKKLFGEEDGEKPPAGPASPDGGSPPGATPPPSQTMTLEDQEAAQQLLATRTAALGADLQDPVFRFFAGRVAKVDDAGNPINLEQQIDSAVADSRNYLVGEYAKQSNLDPKDPLVVHYSSTCPTVDTEGKPIPLAHQAAHVIRQVQAYNERLRSQVLQHVNTPMASGMPSGARPGAQGAGNSPSAPLSLDDALGKANQSRTL